MESIHEIIKNHYEEELKDKAAYCELAKYCQENNMHHEYRVFKDLSYEEGTHAEILKHLLCHTSDMAHTINIDVPTGTNHNISHIA